MFNNVMTPFATLFPETRCFHQHHEIFKTQIASP